MKRALLIASILALPAAILAFPLWLDSPTRSNPYDAKSPLYQAPTPVPVDTATITPTFSPTPTLSPTASPTVIPTATYLFDDFEQPFVGAPWTGGPNAITVSWDSSAPFAGLYCVKVQVGPGATWGHWFGFNASSLQQGGNPVETLGGATNVDITYKVSSNLSLEFDWVEGTTLGADGEDWAADINLTASAGWQTITIPLSAFTAATPSNGIQDTQSIQAVWCYLGTLTFVPYPGLTLYIDNVRFWH